MSGVPSCFSDRRNSERMRLKVSKLSPRTLAAGTVTLALPDHRVSDIIDDDRGPLNAARPSEFRSRRVSDFGSQARGLDENAFGRVTGLGRSSLVMGTSCSRRGSLSIFSCLREQSDITVSLENSKPSSGRRRSATLFMNNRSWSHASHLSFAVAFDRVVD